jgi:L-ribulokinase
VIVGGRNRPAGCVPDASGPKPISGGETMTGDLVLGLDFGTDSVRVLVVDAATGKELATEVAPYERWKRGSWCEPGRNQFRQHPLDYTESMERAVRGALAKLPPGSASRVKGIGVDTTGSTPCAVDRAGTPLALTERFRENPNAMFVLWKDHTAVAEADEINTLARSWGGTDFTKYEGGVYSSEWFWAKVLHVLRTDPAVRDGAYSWVEHSDWIPALLTGTTEPGRMKRDRCAAGHKAMWHAEWDGLPAEAFLVRLDPLLKGLRERLYRETWTSDVSAGGLTPEWAGRLGLHPGTAVAVGAFDAHMGAVGGGVAEGALVKIMGTSTCDIIVAPQTAIRGRQIAGICGQVDGSVLPGMIGLEAGQSAFGDVYAWFREILAWSLRKLGGGEAAVGGILEALAEEAAGLEPSTTALVALDWLNGRRTPFADQKLKGVIAGLTLGTTAPRIYRALVEATAFGSRAIIDQFRREGVVIREVIALGGVSQRSDFVMQTTADILGMPIRVARSEQAVALGAAMFASVAAGIHATVPAAQAAMSSGFKATLHPDSSRAAAYNDLYAKYLELGKSLEPFLRTL